MNIKVFLFLTMTLLLTACSEDKITSENTSNNAIPVETAEVKQETFTKTAELVGKTVPSEQVPITSSVPSPITKVNVEDGDSVQAGDLLFQLDDSDIQQQLAQARSAVATLENTRNQVSAAIQQQRSTQSQINSAINDAITQLEDIELPDQSQGYAAIGNITDTLNQLKQLTGTGSAITSNALPLINSQLEQARKGVRQAEQALKATKITAPIDGTIEQINAKEGAPALPGSPLAIVSSKYELKAIFQVNEFQKQNVSKDMVVKISINDIDDTFDLPIETLSDEPNPETNTYMMTVLLDQIDKPIPSDALATAQINVQSVKGALTVSNKALLFEDDQPYVFLVKNDRAIKQEITIKAQGDRTSYITSGLEKGDLVVTDGKYQLTNRSKISFKK